MAINKYLSVSAECPKKAGEEYKARAVEDTFAQVVKSGAGEGGRVSNYGVDWNDPAVFKVYTLFWREDDSPWRGIPLNTPDETDKWLREASLKIKGALSDYGKVKVTLITEDTTIVEL